jgi:protein-S-isoprenylcysteine O-methyltransferase Ste14
VFIILSRYIVWAGSDYIPGFMDGAVLSGITICEYLWIAFAVIWALWAFGTKETKTRQSIRSSIPYLIISSAAATAMFNHHLPRWLNVRVLPQGSWIANLGIAVTLAGLLISVWARASLGRNWSGTVTVKVGHQLIRSGPYRWVRHPIYSGLVLATIGTATNIGQVRGLIAVALIYIAFIVRTSVEERFMVSIFGEKYHEYRKTSGRMIPGLTDY